MYYYAYGSNLSISYMRQYCPSVTFVMKADLPNYKVAFPHYSQDMQGGISSIIETPGQLVRGVIYQIPKREIDELDILESVPEGLYRRETFLVCGEDRKWCQADLYRVTTPTSHYAPAKGYLDLMIEGAREHDLDPEYIEKLVSWRQALD